MPETSNALQALRREGTWTNGTPKEEVKDLLRVVAEAYNYAEPAQLNSKNKVLHHLNKLKKLQRCKGSTVDVGKHSQPASSTARVAEMLILMQDDYVRQKFLKFKKTEQQEKGMNFLQRMLKDTANRKNFHDLATG